MILTSVHAALWYESLRIGKVRNIDLRIRRAVLDTTRQGDLDETFITGLRNTSGSGTLYYDPEDSAVTTIIDRIYADSTELDDFRLIFDSEVGREVSGTAIITDTGLSASLGAAQTLEISFQFSGKPTSTLST